MIFLIKSTSILRKLKVKKKKKSVKNIRNSYRNISWKEKLIKSKIFLQLLTQFFTQINSHIVLTIFY